MTPQDKNKKQVELNLKWLSENDPVLFKVAINNLK